MSEYLTLKYRPIADALLAKHRLSASSETRDMLAKAIMVERTLPAGFGLRKYSPLPALRSALTNARALLRFAGKPPSRHVSISTRCAKLAAALRDSELVGLTLMLAEPNFDSLDLLDALDLGIPNAHELRSLIKTLEALDPENLRWIVGRPLGLTTPIIRHGCVAWSRARRVEKYSWNDVNECLSGPLPNFLRDLIACCNGTHVLVQKAPQSAPKGHSLPDVIKRGDGLVMTDAALRHAIDRCEKANLLVLG
jgi:hypothetical protein